MKLGEIISEYRKEHGLSLREFAAMCDLSHAYIAYLESGVNPATGKEISPNVSQLRKLSSAMGITIHDLLTRTDEINVDISGEEDDGMAEYLQLLRERPETRMLLEYSKGVSKEDIEAVAEMIKRFKHND